MQVAIAGGHGKIALLLTRRLAAHGDSVVSLIRDPDHAGEVSAAGGKPVVRDLEHASVQEVAETVSGADAVVFAAGAGPGSGASRKLTMDRDGAVKLLHAAASAGVARYVMVSAVGAENPPEGDQTFSVYLRAKAEADAALMQSDRKWTIVRPGGLTDDPGGGGLRIGAEPFRGQVPRDDVAAVIASLLGEPSAAGKVLYVNGGSEPLGAALARLRSEWGGR
jgi:uncharacterized protein YbjT (DUF2867 family)